jgi:hypothetical protein
MVKVCIRLNMGAIATFHFLLAIASLCSVHPTDSHYSRDSWPAPRVDEFQKECQKKLLKCVKASEKSRDMALVECAENR